MSAETPEPARLDQYHEEWGWHEATDDLIAGYGHHMMQMLYRLPIDSQTEDMRTSILAMLDDLDRFAARAAEHDVDLAAVEAERDEAGEGFAQVVKDAARTLARNRLLRRRLAAVEAERDRLRATLDAIETLADWRAMPGLGVDRMIPASDLRAVLDQHPGPDHMQGEA